MSEIKNTDAFEYMKSLPDESFDLVFLDPNYQDWDVFISRGILQETMRILKPSGNVLAFTKQPFDYNLRVAADPYFRREIVWTFENGGAWISPKMPLVSTQKIYWLVKTENFFFNPRTGEAYSETTKAFDRNEKVWEGFRQEGRHFEKSNDGIWLRDHLHFNKPNCGDIPQKPKELIQIFTRCFCPKDGKVFDPFSGSGIIPVVCASFGIEFCASELDENRYSLIMQNLRSFGMDQRKDKKDSQLDIWDFLA